MSAKVKRALREVGLTQYEANAYQLLIERGPLTAKQISLGAQIPYSKVYETLTSLGKKGWIEQEGKRPCKFLPKSPETALKTMKNSFEDHWKQSEKAIMDELVPLYEKMKTREKYDIWIIKGTLNITYKFKEMAKNCKQEMLIAFPYIPDEFLIGLYPLLHPIAEEGLRLCFMVCKGLDENVYKALSRIGEVKFRTKMFGGGVISDGKEVLLLFTDERGEVSAIWSDHPGLAALAKDYFNYLWREPEEPKPRGIQN